MVGAHGFGGLDLVFGETAKVLNERELVLGVVDLAAVQCRPGAVLLGLPKHVERIHGGS